MLPETLTDSTKHGPDAVRVQVAVVELAAHHTALVPDHQEPPVVKGVELTKLLLGGPDRLRLDQKCFVFCFMFYWLNHILQRII